MWMTPLLVDHGLRRSAAQTQNLKSTKTGAHSWGRPALCFDVGEGCSFWDLNKNRTVFFLLSVKKSLLWQGMSTWILCLSTQCGEHTNRSSLSWSQTRTSIPSYFCNIIKDLYFHSSMYLHKAPKQITTLEEKHVGTVIIWLKVSIKHCYLPLVFSFVYSMGIHAWFSLGSAS